MTGDRLGKWVIFKELGRGGMGRVYLAQEELTGRQAALKVLSAELAQDVGFLHRFQREIETLSKLEHPNIVQFYEPGHENGLYFYAMEYVDGQNLDAILTAQGRFPWQEVLDIALQVAPAIRHVHDHGIIHRDLKPSNLLRTSAGTIKLTDFGIAKVFAGNNLTASGGIVGTAEYLSPEQAAGKVVGRRSDLYCLGCVLYALLTGKPPFVGKTYVELLHKHRYGQFDRPGAIVPEIPYEIDDLICQLLEKDPDKRPRDALVFLKQLETIRTRLERKSSQTQADNRERATTAENRTDRLSAADLPGQGPLSRLLRTGTSERDSVGPLGGIFNRAWVLVLLLACCIGILVWAFWPLSQDQLYERGARLMESGRLYDMQMAWSEYLDPLETRYPNHPYKEQVDAFRLKRQAALAGQPASEAQRFFQLGEFHKRQGDLAGAQQVWRNLIAVFGAVETDREWVQRAERGLNELEADSRNKDRFQPVKAALERARRLRIQGKDADAERILTGIEQLYRDDRTAADLLIEVKKARGNQ